MAQRRWTTWGFLLLYLLTFHLAIFPTASEAAQKKPVILGYYVKDWYTDNASFESLTNHYSNLDYAATFAARIDANGNAIVDFPPTEGIELAKRKGVKPLLVVHNMVNGMDSASASAVLGDPNVRWKLANNIYSLVEQYGYAGVNIDFEAVPTWNREDYNKFLWELKGLLKSGNYLLTAAVPAKNADQWDNKWSGAYDYSELGRVCDYIMLMTYDEHWFGGTPGPVASLPWVQSVLDYAVGKMPSQKILLGLAGYGYDWSTYNTQSIKWKDIDDLVQRTGATINWDENSSTPYLYYWNGTEQHEVWFENKYSLGIKMGLVKSYNLGGVGMWRMGFEDDAYWDTLNRKMW